MTHCPVCGDAIAEHDPESLGVCLKTLGVKRTIADRKKAIADAKAASDAA